MKTMTIEEALEIIAFLKGSRIVRICAGEGNLVEYGEPLFLVCVEKTKEEGGRP